MRLAIWGTGDRTRYELKQNKLNLKNVIYFIESNKGQETYCGTPVISPNELVTLQENVNYIVIMNGFYEEIVDECLKYGINTEKLVITDNVPLKPYSIFFNRLKFAIPELYEVIIKQPLILTRANEYDLVDENKLLGKDKYSKQIYSIDYFRYRTFELVANKIINDEVYGDVAELGVFRGTFSSLINSHFKDKRIFLFDTFEGFDDKEANEEKNKGMCNDDFILEHKDTSVDQALSNLPYPDNAIVCKGFFPDSIIEEASDNKYAFVSIDVDFEESMYQGLKFFYPRMSKGGVIFVHDYNTYFLGGIKKAIERYENELGHKMPSIPIADRAGTLVIIKP